jgi:hypothetical protein
VCTALFLTLMIAAGFAFMCDSLPHCGLLSVAAQASSANATVTNNVTVSPVSISLGSTLQATGKVTAGGKPLANASVALHLGDTKLAYTQTNKNGDYFFDVPVSMYYFPAAFSNGATIYTVVEPRDASFISTPSAVTTVSVDVLPLYLIIAVITGAILVGLYFYTRRMHGKAVLGPLGKTRATSAAETKAQAEPFLSGAQPSERGHAIVSEIPPGDSTVKGPQKSPEATSPAETAAPLVDVTQRDAAMQQPEPELPEGVAETNVLKQAHDFFEQGNDRQAVDMLYDAAIIDVATNREVTIASHATHWEKYRSIEAAAPEVQEPLLKLTDIYELAHYSGRTLTEEQRNTAVDAFRAIKAHLGSANT